jgi:hypothetical protein
VTAAGSKEIRCEDTGVIREFLLRLLSDDITVPPKRRFASFYAVNASVSLHRLELAAAA